MNSHFVKLILVFIIMFSLVLWSGQIWNKHLHERDHAGHVLGALVQIELYIEKLQRRLQSAKKTIEHEAINRDIQKIEHYVEKLEEEVAHEHTLSTDMNTLSFQLAQQIKIFHELVERYKSHDAVIKNSIFLLRSQTLNPQVNLNLKLNIQKFLLEYFYKDSALAFTLQERVYSDLETTLLQHVTLVSHEYEEINSISNKMQSLELIGILNKNIKMLEGFVKAKNASNKTFQVFFIVAVLLFLSIVIFMFKKEYNIRVNAERLKSELEQFVNAMDESAIISKTDFRGKITYVNDKFCETSGYSREELIGQPQNIVRHEENSPSIFKEMWSTIKAGKAFKIVLKNRKKDGSEYYVDSVIIPMKDVDGKINEFVGIRYDVTNVVVAKNKAEAAEKAKDDFLSNMSHELRTPLNAILGFSTILEKKIEDVKIKKYLGLIHSSSNQLLSLVNDILDVSKIRSGKFSIDPHNFNAFKDIEGLLHRLDSLTSSKDVQFKSDIDTSLDNTFYGDWMRINQIITNLLSNAIKFTPEKGSIELKTYYKEKKIYIHIKDTGIGMSKEVQEHIFKPFEQADGSTTRKYGGTGLGLTITLKLIEMMNGTLDVDSEEEKGSTFSVILPLDTISSEKRDASALDIEDEGQEDEQFEGHVLAVEDNMTNQILIRLLLEDRGLSCDMADNGEIATQMYDPQTYDLLLMDENMPVMNGLDAFKIIKERYQEKCGPVVALTANALVGDREKFLDAGMDDFIAKPIDEAELQRVLKKYLS